MLLLPASQRLTHELLGDSVPLSCDLAQRKQRRAFFLSMAVRSGCCHIRFWSVQGQMLSGFLALLHSREPQPLSRGTVSNCRAKRQL